MDRKLCLCSSGADSALSSLMWPCPARSKCFTLEKIPKPPLPSLSNISSRSLCPLSLTSASPTKVRKKSEMPQVGTSVSSKGQGKLYQVTRDSGEKHCAQRSSWGNPVVTSYTQESQSQSKCFLTLLLHSFYCDNIYQSQTLTSCVQCCINIAEKAGPWPQSIQCHNTTEKGTSNTEVKGTIGNLPDISILSPFYA